VTSSNHQVKTAIRVLGLLPLAPALETGAIPQPYQQPESRPMPGQTLLFLSAGVVCDQPSQRSYDGNGLSLSLTGPYFDACAEQNAQRDLQGRRAPLMLPLSKPNPWENCV
jgi:hypothetical protein